jgi:hypothetical protein
MSATAIITIGRGLNVELAADRLIAAGWARVSVLLTLNDEGERSYVITGVAPYGVIAQATGETVAETMEAALEDAQ